MQYKEKLIELVNTAKTKNDDIDKLNINTLNNIKIIAEKCFVQKGVFTVLVTLSIYKIFHPEQDIRNHQTQIPNGFSGRTIDTLYITPTLKEVNLPSMAESGWLTRSLEQPYPYNLDYNGKISNKEVKIAFLELINDIQIKNINPENIIVVLFKKIIEIQKDNVVNIIPLDNPDTLTISKIISILQNQFSNHYDSHGGSKLPVLAFYSIYQILIKELSRYKECNLKKLGSHTASDKTSKSSGDIEIFKESILFESIEIKLNKKIDSNMLRIAKEKIIKFNPKRYYIFSFIGYNENELDEINKIINEVKIEHGCQIVVNGVIPTLKYYLRLIEDLNLFIINYTNMIQMDNELKAVHKQEWNKYIKELNKDV
jgi:DNA (cytosine-5)-methyltransferase 1